MTTLPPDVVGLLNVALTAELTVIDERGRMHTDPLIPMWDGQKILMTSSVLFSRKLERIKANPKVSVSLSDPVACPVTPFLRATIQGDARVIDGDIHQDWERVLPLWTAKEPSVSKLLGFRFALPLFWERSVIEITPRRAFVWSGGDTTRVPTVVDLSEGAA